jgi:hypothetical protein
MSTLPDPVDTIERFAEISALLDDTFAERDEVLRAFGLDAEIWARIEARWLLRFQEAEGTELGKRFGKAYRETVQRLAGTAPTTEEAADTEPEGPGFLNTTAQPWRAEAAVVGQSASGAPPPLLAAPEATLHLGAALPLALPAVPPDVGDTLDSAGPLPLPVLPFHPPQPPQAEDEGPDATLPLGAQLPRPALPFTPR